MLCLLYRSNIIINKCYSFNFWDTIIIIIIISRHPTSNSMYVSNVFICILVHVWSKAHIIYIYIYVLTGMYASPIYVRVSLFGHVAIAFNGLNNTYIIHGRALYIHTKYIYTIYIYA